MSKYTVSALQALVAPEPLPDYVADDFTRAILLKSPHLRKADDFNDTMESIASASTIITVKQLSDINFSIWDYVRPLLAEQIAQRGENLGYLSGWALGLPMLYSTTYLDNGDMVYTLYAALLANANE